MTTYHITKTITDPRLTHLEPRNPVATRRRVDTAATAFWRLVKEAVSDAAMLDRTAGLVAISKATSLNGVPIWIIGTSFTVAIPNSYWALTIERVA